MNDSPRHIAPVLFIFAFCALIVIGLLMLTKGMDAGWGTIGALGLVVIALGLIGLAIERLIEKIGRPRD